MANLVGGPAGVGWQTRRVGRARFDEVLDGLVARGALGAQDAASLRTASRWPFGAVEAAAALGGLLVGVGVLVVLGSLVADLSQLAFAAVLLVLAAAAWLARRALGGRTGAVLARDVLEVVAIALGAFAVGTAVDRTGLRGEATAFVVALPVALLGAWRAGRTRVAGSVVGPVASVVAALAGTALLRDDADVASLVLVAVGTAILVWVGRARPGAPSVARLVGALAVTVGVLVPPPDPAPEALRVAASLAVAIALFVVGARAVRLEVLAPAAVGLAWAVYRALDAAIEDDTLVGAATIVIGAVVLAATVRRLRVSRPRG